MGGGPTTDFFSRGGAFEATAPKSFLGTGFAIGLSAGFFVASRTWGTGGPFLASARGYGVGVSLLPAGELGVSCFGEARGGEADAVGFGASLGEVLGVFSALGRGDLVDVLFVIGLRKGVAGTGFFFSVCGGDVVTDFITARLGLVCFPFASARGGVMGVDFFTGAFEEVLGVIAFFKSAREGEAGAVFIEVALGGETGGDAVFTVSRCFPPLAVVVVTELATEDAEAPTCVVLTVNGVA